MASEGIIADVELAREFMDALVLRLQKHLGAQVQERPWFEVQERCDSLRDAMLDLQRALRGFTAAARA